VMVSAETRAGGDPGRPPGFIVPRPAGAGGARGRPVGGGVPTGGRFCFSRGARWTGGGGRVFGATPRRRAPPTEKRAEVPSGGEGKARGGTGAGGLGRGGLGGRGGGRGLHLEPRGFDGPGGGPTGQTVGGNRWGEGVPGRVRKGVQGLGPGGRKKTKAHAGQRKNGRGGGGNLFIFFFFSGAGLFYPGGGQLSRSGMESATPGFESAVLTTPSLAFFGVAWGAAGPFRPPPGKIVLLPRLPKGGAGGASFKKPLGGGFQSGWRGAGHPHGGGGGCSQGGFVFLGQGVVGAGATGSGGGKFFLSGGGESPGGPRGPRISPTAVGLPG